MIKIVANMLKFKKAEPILDNTLKGIRGEQLDNRNKFVFCAPGLNILSVFFFVQ